MKTECSCGMTGTTIFDHKMGCEVAQERYKRLTTDKVVEVPLTDYIDMLGWRVLFYETVNIFDKELIERLKNEIKHLKEINENATL